MTGRHVIDLKVGACYCFHVFMFVCPIIESGGIRMAIAIDSLMR